MEIKEFDKVLLKNGQEVVIIDIGVRADGKRGYLAEYKVPDGESEFVPYYEQIGITDADIEKVIH